MNKEPETLVAEAFEQAHALIQEAKGIADNGSVTDHLDFVEHWLNKAEEALATLSSKGRGEAPEPTREVAWLVEFLPSGDSYRGGKRVGPATPTQYYGGIRADARLKKTRTTDPNAAMRFSRRQDAEEMILLLNDNDFGPVNAVATEHMWIGEAPEPCSPVAREVLQVCANRFWEYVVSHEAKKTAEGHDKAQHNREMALMCEAALAQTPPALSGGGELRFIAAIIEQSPNGETVSVKYHPDGEWTVYDRDAGPMLAALAQSTPAVGEGL